MYETIIYFISVCETQNQLKHLLDMTNRGAWVPAGITRKQMDELIIIMQNKSNHIKKWNNN